MPPFLPPSFHTCLEEQPCPNAVGKGTQMSVMLAPPSRACDQSSNSKALITKNWGIRITNAHQRRRINFLRLLGKLQTGRGKDS